MQISRSVCYNYLLRIRRYAINDKHWSIVFVNRNAYLNSINFFNNYSAKQDYTPVTYNTANENNESRNRKLFGLLIALGVIVGNHLRNNKSNVECYSASDDYNKKLRDAIITARDLTQRKKDEIGAPGISIAVSINGQVVWSEGLGFADVENRIPCHDHTVMRIASISKSITMAIVAKLWEDGKLDIDLPVQHYVPDFGEKFYNGKKVTITTRMLLSHLGGIRHYDKNCDRPIEEIRNKNQTENISNEVEANSKQEQSSKPEFSNSEYYLVKKFKSIRESLELFQNDELCSEPGTQFLYTSHGWTLISAVAENAAGIKFTKLLKSLFKELGMQETYLDKNEPLIYNRARYYVKNKKGRLVNTLPVDNSYKWAGGGILSTVHDLLQFGNAMLYSYQLTPSVVVNSRTNTNNANVSEVAMDNAGFVKTTVTDYAQETFLPGYLKQETMKKIWTPVENTKASWIEDGAYAMGWGVASSKQSIGYGQKQWHYVSHTGGAVGASSVLLVLPLDKDQALQNEEVKSVPVQGVDNLRNTVIPPKGIVVAAITNLQSAGLNSLALQIAHVFRKATENDF